MSLALFACLGVNGFASTGTSFLCTGRPTVSGSTVSLPVVFESGSGDTAALQWKIDIPGVDALAYEEAAAAKQAGKKIQCKAGACLLSGSDGTKIPNGVVANLKFQLPNSASDTLAVHFVSAGESLFDGAAGAISGQSTSLSLRGLTLPYEENTPESSDDAAYSSRGRVRLVIKGSASEAGNLQNGSRVSPTVAPETLSGVVVVNGKSTVNYVPALGGNGVLFESCCEPAATAYFKFTDASLGRVFDSRGGQISFDLKSQSSFAARQTQATSPRYVFDVRDGDVNSHLFYFSSEVKDGGLLLRYATGDAKGSSYLVPKGTEDSLLGDGTMLKVTMNWDGKTSKLLLNDVLVNSVSYTPVTPNWTSESNFDLGAYENARHGGSNGSEDIIADFVVGATNASASPALSFAAPVLQAKLESDEFSGTESNAVVTPRVAPKGFTGTVVSNGKCPVNFTPAVIGNGVYLTDCCDPANPTYLKFANSAVGRIFDVREGQISFYLKSRSSFTARQSLASALRYAFDVHDDSINNHLFSFATDVRDGSLVFRYATGGIREETYSVPKGTEDSLFGEGTSLKITLSWKGETGNLYLNDVLVDSVTRTPAAPNWTSESGLTIGAREGTGRLGQNAFDDVIDEFTVLLPMQ